MIFLYHLRHYAYSIFAFAAATLRARRCFFIFHARDYLFRRRAAAGFATPRIAPYVNKWLRQRH